MIILVKDGEEVARLTLEVNYFAIPEEKAKRNTAFFAKSFEHL